MASENLEDTIQKIYNTRNTIKHYLINAQNVWEIKRPKDWEDDVKIKNNIETAWNLYENLDAKLIKEENEIIKKKARMRNWATFMAFCGIGGLTISFFIGFIPAEIINANLKNQFSQFASYAIFLFGVFSLIGVFMLVLFKKKKDQKIEFYIKEMNHINREYFDVLNKSRKQ